MYRTVFIIFSVTQNHQQKGAFYSGIVAEPPKSTNKNRYLVFFDDGWVQVKETSCFPILNKGQDPDPEHCHDAEIDTAVTFLYVMNADPVMPFLFYLSQQIIRE